MMLITTLLLVMTLIWRSTFRKPFAEDYRKNRVAIEKRVESLETMSIVSALLAGFQLTCLIEVDMRPSAWKWFAHANLLYVVSSLLAFIGFLYVAVMGSFVKVAVKRVESWDDKLQPKTPQAISEHKDYKKTMHLLYGSEKDPWLKKHRDNAKERAGEEENIKILKLPLAYWIFRESCEGPTSTVGIGVLMLPWSVFFFAMSTGSVISNNVHTPGKIVVLVMLVPFSLMMLVKSHKYVRLFVM